MAGSWGAMQAKSGIVCEGRKFIRRFLEGHQAVLLSTSHLTRWDTLLAVGREKALCWFRPLIGVTWQNSCTLPKGIEGNCPR
jgi:hypothetical protein